MDFFSDLGYHQDGARKREIARQACLNRANLSFYCNSQGLSKSAAARKQYGVLPKVFGAAFFKKGQSYYRPSTKSSRAVAQASGCSMKLIWPEVSIHATLACGWAATMIADVTNHHFQK